MKVSVTLVRLAMAVLAAVGGLGVGIYAVLWVLVKTSNEQFAQTSSERLRGQGLAVLGMLGFLASVSVLSSSNAMLMAPVLVVIVGAGLVWQEFDRSPELAPRTSVEWARMTSGATLVVVGLIVAVASSVDFSSLQSSLLAVVATLVGVFLLTAPLWLRQLRLFEAERAARVREAERTKIAAHLHDSVLQTLALIQKQSDDPLQVSRLARYQERELRQWLFSSDPTAAQLEGTLVAAMETLASQVDSDYGLRVIPVVVGGDVAVDSAMEALLGAIRESLVNVAKHAGVETVDVYCEVGESLVEAYVRDRGCGFDPEKIDDDRHGIAQSIRGRLKSCEGTAAIRSSAGRGTEVTLSVPRSHCDETTQEST